MNTTTNTNQAPKICTRPLKLCCNRFKYAACFYDHIRTEHPMQLQRVHDRMIKKVLTNKAEIVHHRRRTTIYNKLKQIGQKPIQISVIKRNYLATAIWLRTVTSQLLSQLFLFQNISIHFNTNLTILDSNHLEMPLSW